MIDHLFQPFFLSKIQMVDLVYYLINLLFFDIPILYCYINLRSLIIFWPYSRDIYVSSGISSLCSFVTVSKLFCDELFKKFLVLAILLPIKSPVVPAVFLIRFLEAVLKASLVDCLAWWRSFWLYLPLTFLIIFLPVFYTYF